MYSTLIAAIAALSVMTTSCQNVPEHPIEAGRPTAVYFTEISEAAGLNFTHNPGVDGSYFTPESMGSGVAVFDYDNDNDLDIYFINGAWHGELSKNRQQLQNQLFRQEPDGSFSTVTATSGLGDTGYGMGVACGDIDNDGFVDVYVSNYGADALYRNNGDGTFSNITDAAGVVNAAWGCSVLYFDFNLDGYLDIFVTNYIDYDSTATCSDKAGRPDYCGPTNFPGASDVLFRNNGDLTFTNISKEAGIADVKSVSLGVASGDFNNDGLPDVYVANDGQENQLWLNKGDGTFDENAVIWGAATNNVGRSEAGMGVAIGDYDSDQDQDLFLSHLRTESNTLYRNESHGRFSDVTHLAKLGANSLSYTGFGTAFLDFDHDGDLDIAVVNGRVTRGPLLTSPRKEHSYWDDYAEPNLLYENMDRRLFRNISAEAPVFSSKYIENSRGLAIGDMDNDGDLDLLVTNEGGPARLYRNDIPEKGNWLSLRAYLPELKRDAIGAKITVYLNEKILSREVNATYSYLSSNDPRVHFGLGTAARTDSVIVVWPNGQRDHFGQLQANQFFTLSMGGSAVLAHKQTEAH